MDGLGLKRIALTGGIGSGKSTVAAMLVEHGATLVDTDAISRSITAAGGAAMPALREAFGDTIAGPDGALDRDAMRALAFTDPLVRTRLEAVLHPMIGAEALAMAAAAGPRTVVFDVPLLGPASHWRMLAARVLVVDCSEATQAARVALRPGWSHELAGRVINQQLPRPERRALADAVIHNDGLSLDTLREEVAALWARWA